MIVGRREEDGRVVAVSPQKVLILESKSGSRESLMNAAHGIDARAVTSLVFTISEAIRALGRSGYDAVLL